MKTWLAAPPTDAEPTRDPDWEGVYASLEHSESDPPDVLTFWVEFPDGWIYQTRIPAAVNDYPELFDHTMQMLIWQIDIRRTGRRIASTQ